MARASVDIGAQVIQNIAQPTDDESLAAASWAADLLPSFLGRRTDLELDGVAPTRCAVRG